MGVRTPALLGLSLLVGAGLRALRVPARWDEIALAYAAYTEPMVQALRAGEVGTALGSWVGLHPPLHAALHALTELFFPVPLLWLLGSAVASFLAVLVVGRTGGWIAALVMATAPLQLADAAEVNNYPLAVLGVAVLLATARGPWRWLAAAAGLAAWSHLLGLAAAVGVVGWRLLHARTEQERRPLVAAVVLVCLPVFVGALALASRGGTYGQPSVEFVAWVSLLVEAVGLEGVLLGVVALWTLRDESLALWLGLAVALGAAILVGAAAAHQRPYYALLGPPIALALARNPRRWVQALVVVLCLVRGVRGGAQELARLATLQDDQVQVRAVDLALSSSESGDTVWLVAPALQPDDDKSAISPVLWRVRPWSHLPMAFPVDFEYTDYRYGQPRTWEDRTLHTSTELDEAAFDHVARTALDGGHEIWVVVYEHGPATGMLDRIEHVLRPYVWTMQEQGGTAELGRDRLYRLTALRGGGV